MLSEGSWSSSRWFAFLVIFFFRPSGLCNAYLASEMKIFFSITSSTHVLSCRLPNFFRFLPCSISMSFEGTQSSLYWPVPFVYDRRFVRGHSSLTLPFGVWARGSELLVALREPSYPWPVLRALLEIEDFDKNPNPHWDEVSCIFDVIYFPFVADAVRRFPF